MPKAQGRRMGRTAKAMLAVVLCLLAAQASSLSAAHVRSSARLGLPALPGTAAPAAGRPTPAGLRLIPSPAPGLPALAPAPGLIPAAAARPEAAAALPVARLAEAVRAESALLQSADLGAEASASSGRRIEDLMTGGRSISGADSPAAAAAAAAAPALPAAAPQAAPARSVPAAAAPAPQATDSSAMYAAKRRILAAVASAFGIVASLPPAGPSLAQKVLDKAASKRVVFSDFDDTLGPYNSVLTPEMVAAITAVRRSGKEVVIVSDRGDEKRPGGSQLTVFESLASMPAGDRAGMYLAANSGGRVYRYNSQGEPERVYEYPILAGERRAPVTAAAAALKARLAELGTSQHPGDERGPAESWNPYGYALMLAVGTPEAVVKKTAAAFQEELDKQGLEVGVLARMAKDPNNPPYVTFSVVDKSVSVRYIAEALHAGSGESLALGDNMYLPKSPEGPGRIMRKILRWAERLSGRPVPLTGNETDRNMEKALPGMLALSVGGTADPRMAEAYVLPGRGAPASLRVLQAMASRPAGTDIPQQP